LSCASLTTLFAIDTIAEEKMKRYLIIALLSVSPLSNAQDMMYLDAANSMAGANVMNAVICNQTNTCSGSSSPAHQAAVNAWLKDIRVCKNAVIERTDSGTPQRTAGLEECKRKYPDPDKKPVAAAKPSGSGNRSNTNINDPINYRVDAAVSEKVKTAIIRSATAKASNPERLRNLIQTQNVQTLFNQMMNQHGLRSQNFVDSSTAYWLTNWMVANRSNMPNREMVNGVRSQMMAAAHQSGFGKRDDASNQRESEIMMWQTILLIAAYQNPQMDKAGLSKEINSNATRLGMDLSKLTVSKNGFVAR
jgi:hypothetical protein